MPSLKSTVRLVLAVAFSINIALFLGAQSKTSPGSARNPDAGKERILTHLLQRVRGCDARIFIEAVDHSVRDVIRIRPLPFVFPLALYFHNKRVPAHAC